MDTLNFTIVYTENKNISIKNEYTFCSKKVSLFYVENNVNIYIDTLNIIHSNYAEFGELCLVKVLDYLDKKVTDFKTISPLVVSH